MFTFLFSLSATVCIEQFVHFPSFESTLHFLGASFFCTLGLLYYIKSINVLSFSNAGALYITGNVIQQLAGIFFLKEQFHPLMLISWVLMSFGTIYQLCFTEWKKGAGYVLLSSLFWTAGYIWMSYALKGNSIFWSVTIMEATILITSTIIMFKNSKSLFSFEKIPIKKILIYCLLGLIIYAGSLASNYSYQKNGLLEISYMQLSMIPILFILSMKLFQEKLKAVEIISFFTGLFGFLLYIWIKLK
jgi:drug/metabolite transporter (DMT)-like permease